MATNCTDYNFTKIENHWQKYWESNKTFKAIDNADKPKYYLLDMFPYPSGAGLHAGHVENFAASDILGRFKFAQGFNVLHPMGWDAFGLPAEQYAVKTGTHPAITTKENIKNFTRQLQQLGFAIDWDREISTTDPEYFKWTQWIFLQLFKKGLAYVDERPVNWCPALGTVLANEEVVEGKSEVGGHPVERRNLRQWVLRITAYADRLIDGLNDVNWPDSTKSMQKNWIGKSTGAEVDFELENNLGKLRVYTTRPDTLFGATYMVIAPEHPLVSSLTTAEKKSEVEKYIEKAAHKSDLDRTELNKDKTGVFTGSYAINPVNDKRVPVWIADYVLMSYGTGAIMAVPGHDERDFEFAKKFDIPILRVVTHTEGDNKAELPYTEHGIAVNSGEFDRLPTTEAKAKIITWLESKKAGKEAVNYKLRDWLFSRQRYWGEPFPILWVSETDYKKAQTTKGVVRENLPDEAVTFEEENTISFAIPLPEQALPLTLPQTDDYKPSGNGESPLATINEWVNVWLNLETGETSSATLDKPEGENWINARRETNTMPQWAGSCWYYLRYIDPKNSEALIDPKLRDYWGVPNFYMGGAEHAVLHLLYARFWHHFLVDIGVLKEPEPFSRLFHQGIILGEDGEKMSKSRGNTISPDDFIESHGADSLRTYIMFMGPLEDMKPWKSQGIEGVFRFLKKIWREFIGPEGTVSPKLFTDGEESKETLKLLHQTIKKVTEDLENIRFNTAISQMMIFMNHVAKVDRLHLDSAKKLVQLVAPFAPHLAEEIWERLGEAPSVTLAPWPNYDESLLVSDEVKIGLLVNGKPRGEALVAKTATQESVLELAKSQDKIAVQLEGKTIRKIIYVPGKIINIVAT